MAATLAISATAHAGSYVDNTLGDVPAAQMIKVSNPRPVQLLFEFDRSERSNPRATKAATPIVKDELKKLGIVGAVSDTPVPDGARLVVTIDNVGEKDAAGKGAKVGLTLGLAGTTVTDDYTFVIRYTPVSGAQPIERTVHHRIYTKIGLGGSAPANATKADNMLAAFTIVVHQALAHGLNDIAADPRFAPPAPAPAGGSAGPAPAANATPAPVPAATPAAQP